MPGSATDEIRARRLRLGRFSSQVAVMVVVGPGRRILLGGLS